MVKHTQTIRRLLLMNYLNVSDHFVGLALKGLNLLHKEIRYKKSHIRTLKREFENLCNALQLEMKIITLLTLLIFK